MLARADARRRGCMHAYACTLCDASRLAPLDAPARMHGCVHACARPRPRPPPAPAPCTIIPGPLRLWCPPLMYSTLLQRINTSPSAPTDWPSMNSSALASCRFMYESTDTCAGGGGNHGAARGRRLLGATLGPHRVCSSGRGAHQVALVLHAPLELHVHLLAGEVVEEGLGVDGHASGGHAAAAAASVLACLLMPSAHAKGRGQLFHLSRGFAEDAPA